MNKKFKGKLKDFPNKAQKRKLLKMGLKSDQDVFLSINPEKTVKKSKSSKS